MIDGSDRVSVPLLTEPPVTMDANSLDGIIFLTGRSRQMMAPALPDGLAALEFAK
jgi:hypothetical protein